MKRGARLDETALEAVITKQGWKFNGITSGPSPIVHVVTFRVARAPTADHPDLSDLSERFAAQDGVQAASIDALGHASVLQKEGASLADDFLRRVATDSGATLDDLSRTDWSVTPARYQIVLDRFDAVNAERAWKASRDVEKVLWAEIDPAAARITIVLNEACSRIEERTRAALEAAGFTVKEFRAL